MTTDRDERPSVLGNSIESAVQRNDALRVLGLALASNGIVTDPAPILRDMEEGGYTMRLTTDDERRLRNEQFQ